MQCPKCAGQMRTYNRNGVQIEQCDTCRGIFLDFGELEHLTQMQAAYAAPPPPPAHGYAHGAPAWGAQHAYGHHPRQKSWVHMLFST